MRTNIDIDDELMDAAMKAGNHKTKAEAVRAGLRALIEQAKRRKASQGAIDLFGAFPDWGDDYKYLRRGQPVPKPDGQ